MNVQKIFNLVRPPRVRFIKYAAEHMMDLVNADPDHLGKTVSPTNAKALEQTEGFTAVRNGRVVACGGLIEHWPGRCEAWCVFAKDIGVFGFLSVHRFAKGVVEAHPARRVEVCLDYKSAIEARWVRSLGFYLEIPRLRNYWPGHRDGSMYVRIK